MQFDTAGLCTTISPCKYTQFVQTSIECCLYKCTVTVCPISQATVGGVGGGVSWHQLHLQPWDLEDAC